MKRKLLLLLYVVLLIPVVSFAEDFELNPADFYAQDFEETKALAEQGDISAQHKLGGMYDVGRGIPENDSKAVKWYRKVAEQGIAGAQIDLAHMYANGEGVPLNFTETYIWQSLAATSGRRSAVIERVFYASKLSPEELNTAQQRAAKLFEKIEARKAVQE